MWRLLLDDEHWPLMRKHLATDLILDQVHRFLGDQRAQDDLTLVVGGEDGDDAVAVDAAVGLRCHRPGGHLLLHPCADGRGNLSLRTPGIRGAGGIWQFPEERHHGVFRRFRDDRAAQSPGGDGRLPHLVRPRPLPYRLPARSALRHPPGRGGGQLRFACHACLAGLQDPGRWQGTVDDGPGHASDRARALRSRPHRDQEAGTHRRDAEWGQRRLPFRLDRADGLRPSSRRFPAGGNRKWEQGRPLLATDAADEGREGGHQADHPHRAQPDRFDQLGNGGRGRSQGDLLPGRRPVRRHHLFLPPDHGAYRP